MLFIISFIYDIIFLSHNNLKNLKEYDNFLFLFKEEYVKDIDRFTASSYVEKNDVLTTINYVPGISLLDKEKQIGFGYRSDIVYHINIWEFKKLTKLSIDSVPIYLKKTLGDLEVSWGEILEPESEQPIAIKFRYDYSKMSINVDEGSIISDSAIRGKNFKGFFGEINRISLSNENEKHKIFMDYIPRMQVLFLVVNKYNQFYIITVTCNKSFDESIIDIFDLE